MPAGAGAWLKRKLDGVWRAIAKGVPSARISATSASAGYAASWQPLSWVSQRSAKAAQEQCEAASAGSGQDAPCGDPILYMRRIAKF